MLKTKKEIIKWLDNFSIENYNLVENHEYGFVVDVSSDVFLSHHGLKEIPIKFNKIEGDFDCSSNELIDLKFAPLKVDGNFHCGDNKLLSLEGCPQDIGGEVDFSMNKLKSLQGCLPVVNSHFFCNNNLLLNLEHGPNEVYGEYHCDKNKLETVAFLPKLVETYFICSGNPKLKKIQKMEKLDDILNSERYQEDLVILRKNNLTNKLQEQLIIVDEQTPRCKI